MGMSQMPVISQGLQIIEFSSNTVKFPDPISISVVKLRTKIS